MSIPDVPVSPLASINPIPPDWLAVLDAICRATHAVTPRCELTDWPGVPYVRHCDETIDAMLAANWLVEWTLRPKMLRFLRPWIKAEELKKPIVAVTIHPCVAEWMMIELIEEGPADRPRWGRTVDGGASGEGGIVGESPLPNWRWLPAASARAEPQPFVATLIPRPEDVIEHRPGPVEEAVIKEEIRERSGKIVLKPVLTTEVVDGDGRPKLDPETGKPVRQAVVMWGKRVEKVKKPLKGKNVRA